MKLGNNTHKRSLGRNKKTKIRGGARNVTKEFGTRGTG